MLHLQTADGFDVDQMCLGKRIAGAGIYPDGKKLRVVIAVDTEVNCWTIELPEPPSAPGLENVPPPARESVKSPEPPSA